MNDQWTWATVADPAVLEPEPPSMPPREAQDWCNFVVWMPTELPADVVPEAASVRKEAPPGRPASSAGRATWSECNPSSFRFELAGHERRARVKQFLYDWAFPALDHPSLFGNPATPVVLDDRYVLWTGTDHKGNSAATARIARTTIEFSVLRGEFTEAEVLGVFRSLAPAVPEALPGIARIPFPELGYWARHPTAAVVEVPTGLWRFPREEGENHVVWLEDAAAGHDGVRLPGRLGGMNLDGAAVFSDGAGATELEAVYAGGPDRGHELRLVVQRKGKGRLEWPPAPERVAALRTPVQGDQWQGMLACLDENVGPCDAVVEIPAADLELRLCGSTGPGMGRTWFSGVVRQVCEAGLR
ncbi:hypothetical protein [Amycolatopsis sp. NPDC004079]|uniref:hypothetical protein n=1 Tax=Amycolatopsis sp. NPDC004079 TaxID=3154549 RepID=UPI0033B66ED7